jgi:hypothetical protein
VKNFWFDVKIYNTKWCWENRQPSDIIDGFGSLKEAVKEASIRTRVYQAVVVARGEDNKYEPGEYVFMLHERSLGNPTAEEKALTEAKMGNVVVWNTGRHYSREGQRIAAQVLEDGRIVFVDIDRGIDGIIKGKTIDTALAVIVMNAYDENDYSAIPVWESEDMRVLKGCLSAAAQWPGWQPVPEFGGFVKLEGKDLLYAPMSLDGGMDLWNNEPNACEVTAPDSQDFLERVNNLYGTEFLMDQFAGR